MHIAHGNIYTNTCIFWCALCKCFFKHTCILLCHPPCRQFSKLQSFHSWGWLGVMWLKPILLVSVPASPLSWPEPRLELPPEDDTASPLFGDNEENDNFTFGQLSIKNTHAHQNAHDCRKWKLVDASCHLISRWLSLTVSWVTYIAECCNQGDS